MDIGALVELSSSARKLKWTKEYRGKIGMVTWINPSYSWFRVKWIGVTNRMYGLAMGPMFSRSHLKYAKKK